MLKYEARITSGRIEAVKMAKPVMGYCVKEKKKREIKNPKQVKLKNGRPAVKGVCASCGSGMYRIGKL